MSHNDFVEKLADFFDPEQIENLEKFAEESARDVSTETDAGRQFVCELLYDYMGEEYPEAAALIEGIAGGLFLRSTYNDLLEQMQKEW